MVEVSARKTYFVDYQHWFLVNKKIKVPTRILTGIKKRLTTPVINFIYLRCEYHKVDSIKKVNLILSHCIYLGIPKKDFSRST